MEQPGYFSRHNGFLSLETGNGKGSRGELLVIRSPYAKFGIMFETYRRFYGQNDHNVLMWQAPTTVMNPTITQEFIDQEMPRDVESRKV